LPWPNAPLPHRGSKLCRQFRVPEQLPTGATADVEKLWGHLFGTSIDHGGCSTSISVFPGKHVQCIESTDKTNIKEKHVMMMVMVVLMVVMMMMIVMMVVIVMMLMTVMMVMMMMMLMMLMILTMVMMVMMVMMMMMMWWWWW